MQISGLASGIDTQALVEQLMSLERKPISLMTTKKSLYENRMNAWRDINSRLTSLKTQIEGLKNIDFTKASSSESAVATASGNVNGSYSLEVVTVATATKAISSNPIASRVDQTQLLNYGGWDITPNVGTFTINGVAISVDATSTLDSLINDINKDPALGGVPGVTASNVNGTFTIRSDDNATELSLGSVTDTSNFLKATKVLSQSGAGVYEVSSSMLGKDAQLEVSLETAGLNGLIKTADAGGTTEFTINGQNFSYDTANTTLQGIMDMVNGNSDAKVIMSYDAFQDKVSLKSTESGRFNVELNDNSGNLLASLNLTNATQELGTNAVYKLNGVTMTSTSNDISNVVQGVTFNLKGVGETTIAQDVSSPFEKIKTFVSQYNSAQDFIASKLEKKEILQGDFTLINLQTNLRTKSTGLVTGLTGFNHLKAIGIDSSKEGKLTIDETALKEAMKNNGDSVNALFNDTTDGIATRLTSYVEGFVKSGSGILPTKEKSFQNQIKDINKRITQMEERLEMRKATMTRQFNAMEKTMSQLINQGDWLTGQLGQLGGWNQLNRN